MRTLVADEGVPMNVIRVHNVTIQGGNGKFNITLRPLTDAYLPLLSKWYSDPEVLYWTEFEEVEPYTPEIVEKMYQAVSQKALCFAVEANGNTIGDCWLQEMNLPEVIAMYPAGTDIRRIDMAIGEKDYWGKGIGSIFVKMLIDYAFRVQKVDVLHCLCADYNLRSRRMWQKYGFTCVLKEKIPEMRENGVVCHWQLTKEKYQSLPLGEGGSPKG